MQRTQKFDVNGHKIKVFIKSKTYYNHRNGYRAVVTDNQGNELKVPHINVLYPEEAIESAYVRFVKEFV